MRSIDELLDAVREFSAGRHELQGLFARPIFRRRPAPTWVETIESAVDELIDGVVRTTALDEHVREQLVVALVALWIGYKRLPIDGGIAAARVELERLIASKGVTPIGTAKSLVDGAVLAAKCHVNAVGGRDPLRLAAELIKGAA